MSFMTDGWFLRVGGDFYEVVVAKLEFENGLIFLFVLLMFNALFGFNDGHLLLVGTWRM